MKALLVSLLAVVAACGEGRAIFNVDVHSFMAGTGKDTVLYGFLPGLPDTVSAPAQKINLPPGFGSSIVDSVRITNGGANLINASGTGNVGFQLYIAADSLSTYNTSALAINIPATAVSGAQTVPVVITGDLTPGLNALFTQPAIWLRIAAAGSASGGTPVSGKMALTALLVRVVLQDKIF